MVLVSLGSNCAVAHQLDKLNLRKEAYPFDWAKIKLQTLNQILSYDFLDFTNMSVQSFSPKHFAFGKKDAGSYIISNKYGISFAHEVMDICEFSEFIEKQTRRVDRFRKLSNPTFVRLETSNIPKSYNQHYDKLISLLTEYFTDFKLIVISNNPITHDKIKWVRLENFDEDWTYSKLDWVKIFNLEN